MQSRGTSGRGSTGLTTANGRETAFCWGETAVHVRETLTPKPASLHYARYYSSRNVETHLGFKKAVELLLNRGSPEVPVLEFRVECALVSAGQCRGCRIQGLGCRGSNCVTNWVSNWVSNWVFELGFKLGFELGFKLGFELGFELGGVRVVEKALAEVLARALGRRRQPRHLRTNDFSVNFSDFSQLCDMRTRERERIQSTAKRCEPRGV